MVSQMPLLGSPQRLADTRTAGGPIGSGGSRCFLVAGQAGVPAEAVGVVLNVTAVGYGTQGWLSVYPNGLAVPATSTVNFDAAKYAMANGAIVRLGNGGSVCVNVGTINSVPGSSQVVLDVVGYMTGSGMLQLPLLSSPQRLADTRSSGGPIAASSSRCFTIWGQVGVPSNAVGVILNVTAVGYATNGWLTVYPYGQPVPATSTLNFNNALSEYAIANGLIVRLGSGGTVCVNVGAVNSVPGSSHVILDVVGYVAP
jgi:hypothetical protein